MATKVYKLKKPCNNFSFVITGKGGNSLRYEFTGGSVVTGTPARVILRAQYSQDLLEASQIFKDGDVVLESTSEESVAIAQKEKKLKSIEGVTTTEQAILYVANTWGEQVKNAKQAKSFANKQGYDFPELNK